MSRRGTLKRKRKDTEHNCGVMNCVADVAFAHHIQLPKTSGLFPREIKLILFMCDKHSRQYDELHGPALEL